MSARTVIRWYWAGEPWNKPYKAEVVEGTEVLGGATPEELTAWLAAEEERKRSVLDGDDAYDAASEAAEEAWEAWSEVADEQRRCLQCGVVDPEGWGLSYCVEHADDSLLIQCFETADRAAIRTAFETSTSWFSKGPSA